MQKKKKAPNGARLLRVFLILEKLGGASAEFRRRDLCRAYGERWTGEVLRKWIPAGRISRIAVGRYRLSPATAAEARSWLNGDEPFVGLAYRTGDHRTSEEVREAIAEEEAERFRRDEEELERAAEAARLGSPWLAVRERLDEERRLRRSQLGRCILALRASGREMTRAELGEAIGGRPADIVVWQAVKDGKLIRLRPGVYDLPERADAPLWRNSNELVLLTLASLGSASLEALAKAAGLGWRAMKDNPVKRLRKRGHLERVGPGEYRLTPEGWRAAEAVLRTNREAK